MQVTITTTCEFDDGSDDESLRICDAVLAGGSKVTKRQLLLILFDGFEERLKAAGVAMEVEGFST